MASVIGQQKPKRGRSVQNSEPINILDSNSSSSDDDDVSSYHRPGGNQQRGRQMN
jgi:hypothetical protein